MCDQIIMSSLRCQSNCLLLLAPLPPHPGIPDASSLKLIFGGRNLQDAQILSTCGFTASSRVLIVRGAAAGAGGAGGRALDPEEEKQEALERLRRVAESLAGGRERNDRYTLKLENQVCGAG